MSIKRYEIVNKDWGYEENPRGMFVIVSDHIAALKAGKAENERFRDALMNAREAIEWLVLYMKSEAAVTQDAVLSAAEQVGTLRAASQRYLAAVGRLSETSGYNKLTYFEAPISKMPTVDMGEDAAARWIELNNAGRALAAAIRTQDDEVEERDEYGRLARHRDDFDDDAGQFPTR